MTSQRINKAECNLKFMVHCFSSCHRITWTLCVCVCVEGLCSIFFCAISNRFVWVLPLLLPLPVTSWSDSSVLLLRQMSLEVSVRGWSSTDTGIWILGSWESLPGKGGALSNKTHYRGTRAINYELIHCSLLLLLVLFTQIKSAVCPEDFPQEPPCPKAHSCFQFSLHILNNL